MKSLLRSSLRKRLEEKAKKGFRGYPSGSFAFDRPDDRMAPKMVASIDYHGPICPQCPFSAARDRWTVGATPEDRSGFEEAWNVASAVQDADDIDPVGPDAVEYDISSLSK